MKSDRMEKEIVEIEEQSTEMGEECDETDGSVTR